MNKSNPHWAHEVTLGEKSKFMSATETEVNSLSENQLPFREKIIIKNNLDI